MLSLKEKSLQSVLLVVMSLCILYYFYPLWILLIITCSILFLGLLSQFFRNQFHLYWMKFAHLLGLVNGTILLTIIYYLILTPTALLKRLFEKKSKNNMPHNQHSNFVLRNHSYKKGDLENPW